MEKKSNINKTLSNSEFLSGFIAIVGPPNVGKSTLINQILGSKVSIVSSKPQTTRNRILGIYNNEDCQMVFIDTPGIHKTRTSLHKSMVSSAQASLSEVDIVLMMVEFLHSESSDISLILKILKDVMGFEKKRVSKPVILLINKIDQGQRDELLPLMERFGQYDFSSILPVSALKGDGIVELLQAIKKLLKPGPAFFPKDIRTDQTDSFLISEIIREKIYTYTSREIPYSTAVKVSGIEQREAKNLISISAQIYVETASQKKILIGKSGNMIKKIGKSSRLVLEKVFGTRIFLDLIVRVEKNWTKDPRAMRKLGY